MMKRDFFQDCSVAVQLKDVPKRKDFNRRLSIWLLIIMRNSFKKFQKLFFILYPFSIILKEFSFRNDKAKIF